MSDTLKKKLSVGKSIEKKGRPSPSRKDAIKEALDADRRAAGELDDGVNQVDSGDGGDESDIDDDSVYNVRHPTGDKMRDKVRNLLADAMDKPDEDLMSRDEIVVVANAIENAMFEMYGSTDNNYRTKYRDLSFNLKDAKNGKLRERVLNRDIVLKSLLTMSNQELANEELKQTRRKVQAKMTRDAQPSNRPAASTDQFKCGKCKQRKCTYFQMQTRSADEPLTTFVTCVNCNNRWKF